MAVSRESRKLIESRDFSALEDEWIAQLQEDPSDLAYFVGLARALSGSGEEVRAGELLELLDDHLQGEGDWPGRLQLLRRAGELLVQDGDLHGEILSTLRSLYPESPSRDGLIELVGLHRAPGDLPKTWEKVDRFRTLMQFEIGTIVHMQGKGAGRVVDVNLELGSLRVEIEGQPLIGVGLAAAGKLLEPLSEGHFLRRKLEEREEMLRLARDEPGRLLEALLTSQEEPLGAGEIRQALAGIVDGDDWASWWSAARNNPQLVASGKGAKQKYRWATSSAAATDEIVQAFEAAPDLVTRLEIFRREARRDDALRDEMVSRLSDEAAELAAEDPARTLTIWHALERAGADPGEVDWRPSELLRRSSQPASWLLSIEDRALRATAAEWVRKERDDWPEVFTRWMAREEDAKILSQLTEALIEAKSERLEPFLDDVLAHPRRHEPTFPWLVETTGEFDLLGNRNPLRLLQQVVEAPAKANEARYRTRLKKAVAEGPALSHLVTRIEADQAKQTEETLRRAPVADYRRDQLLTQLHLRFPDLRESESDFLYALPDSIARRKSELKALLEEEIPANRRAIEEARALGDLRENFEYKSARQRHEYLSARVAKLQADLTRARPIDLKALDVSRIHVGAAVRLTRGDEQREITILGPWESDPEQGIVSYETETAKKLLGKGVGDSVELEDGGWSVDAIGPARV